MERFNIDFFELSFLAEACIPPRPIARMSFWYKLIDFHYDKLTKEERTLLLDWITKNSSFDIENEDCLLFHNRFNPTNNYKIIVEHKGNIEEYECFLHQGKYYTKSNKWINPELIKEILPLN